MLLRCKSFCYSTLFAIMQCNDIHNHLFDTIYSKLKDYNIVDTATPIRPLSVKKKGLNSWALRSL
jgi:hypothetical protein